VGIEKQTHPSEINRSSAAAVPGTARLEAFSDGVLAIIVTLLIFEIHVPALPNLDTATVAAALWSIAPKFVSFAVSFITLAIFWVNHHHFFHQVTGTDWKLLWHNNLLLFWLTIVPFTTAFIGDNPTQPLVIALYAFVMFMAGFSFTLMGKYVFFKSELLDPAITLAERQREFRRSLMGTSIYALTAVIAFVNVYLALLVLLLIPIFFVVPGLMQRSPETP
jgi:uncharacterized membrane protein